MKLWLLIMMIETMGGDDEGLENESDDYEDTELNDIGGFDEHEDEFDEDRSSMKLR